LSNSTSHPHTCTVKLLSMMEEYGPILLAILLIVICICGVRGLQLCQKPSIGDMEVYFRGKVVWVTGASSGIGKQMAIQASSFGSRVILSGRNETSLQAVAELCGGSADIVAFDVADQKACARAAEKALSEAGRVDILINNAGVSTRSPALETSAGVEENVMAINYFAPVTLTKAVLPGMIARGSGHIAAVNSVQGLFGIHNRTTYAASKHALRGYLDALRAEIAHANISVTQIYPGYVRTNLSKNAFLGDGKKYDTMDKTTENGMDPSYVAQTMLYAISKRKHELVLADTKTKVAAFLRSAMPNLLFKILAKRAKKDLDHRQ